MSLHERIRDARLRKGLPQKAVAEQLGVAKSTYCGYETGQREPNVLQIKQIAQILDVTGDYLIGVESPPPADILYISRPSGDLTTDELRKELHDLIDQLPDEDLVLFKDLTLRMKRE